MWYVLIITFKYYIFWLIVSAQFTPTPQDGLYLLNFLKKHEKKINCLNFTEDNCILMSVDHGMDQLHWNLRDFTLLLEKDVADVKWHDWHSNVGYSMQGIALAAAGQDTLTVCRTTTRDDEARYKLPLCM